MVDKLLQRVNGVTKQYTPITSSAGSGDAGKIPALGSDGKLDPSMYNPGSDPAETLVAYEDIGAGKFYHRFNDSGTLKMRLADAEAGYPAHGFVKALVAKDATGTGYPLDSINSALSGLTLGATYYLSTLGGISATPLDATDPANAGFIDQKLGQATSTTTLATDDYDYVVL